MQGQLRLRIRIRDHSQTHFDATNPMAVLDLQNELMLKIIFFEVSPIVSIYVKLQKLDIRGSVLETEHTSGLVLMSEV